MSSHIAPEPTGPEPAAWPSGRAVAVAHVLDHLAEQIKDVASALRQRDDFATGAPGAERPRCDPWSIVDLVTHDLSRHGIKSRFGPDADLARAAHCAGQMLEALGMHPSGLDNGEAADADSPGK